MLKPIRIRQTVISITSVALLFLLASTSRPQQPAAGGAQSSERPNGSITGRVINPAGEPLLGAMAFVLPVGGNSASGNSSVDSSGNFKVDGLDVGIYRVTANAAGYVTAPQPTTTDPVYYHPGDAVTITLIKGAAISGTVTSPGGPAIAVNVRAIRVRDDEGKAVPSPYAVRERLTDDRGVYRIYALPPGAYLIVAGGPARIGGGAPGAYDTDGPTYSPSATRDTASEIVVRSGDEATADIQYRGEPGHAVSGLVSGTILSQAQSSITIAATISLIDVRDRSTAMNAVASSYNNYSFDMYGVPDGEYEVYASQFQSTREYLRSPGRRITVRGADVTGVRLVLAPLASIEGRVVMEEDPKAGCAKRRETASQETIISARRFEPEAKAGAPAATKDVTPDPLAQMFSVVETVPDAKRVFTIKNLMPGSYRIDTRAPASGWYVRSITIGSNHVAARNPAPPVARDGVTLKSGEHFTGLTVTITEGAASLRGRISVAEGQSLPPRMRVYVVPAEREAAENVLRFLETRAENDGSFVLGRIAPGRYWIIARPEEETELRTVKSIRQDAALRSTIMHEAEALKKEIAFKPCERTTDYDFAYAPPQLPKP